jgi:hypothetical protein
MAQTAQEPPASSSDWTAQTADRIESVVTAVRDKTTVPVQKAARAVVYGLVAGALAFLALVLFLVGLFRLHVYLPFGHNEGRKVWVTYVGVGAIFLGIGGFLWRKRNPLPKG